MCRYIPCTCGWWAWLTHWWPLRWLVRREKCRPTNRRTLFSVDGFVRQQIRQCGRNLSGPITKTAMVWSYRLRATLFITGLILLLDGTVTHIAVTTKRKLEIILFTGVCDRRLYWSDCSEPTTIQTASAIDGSDRRVLINDTQHSCITALVIDVNSQLPLLGRSPP